MFSRIGTTARIDRAAAPAPISGLIDTGQYDGTNPDVTATPSDGRPVIGLAEYSNANFFSNDTIFTDTPALFGVRPFPFQPEPGARAPRAGSGRTGLAAALHPEGAPWRHDGQ